MALQDYRRTIDHRHKLVYLAVMAFWVLTGGWLIQDFLAERKRTVENMSRLAMQQSHLASSLFGNTFLATDYVLSDLMGHVERKLSGSKVDIEPLLEQKLSTVPGLVDLVLLDGHCHFSALAKFKELRGAQSRQGFCSAKRQAPGQTLHWQYMAAESSPNGKSVVLITRVLATSEGRMQAAVLAVMELGYVQKWIDGLKVDGLDMQAILDAEGLLLARNPARPEWLGKQTHFPIDQLSSAQEDRTTSFTGHSPFDSHERIFGMSRMERAPFIVLVGHDMGRTLASWQQRAWQFGIGYAVMLVLSMAFLRVHGRTLIQNAVMYEMATTDTLTGLSNRRHFFNQGERDFARALRHESPLTVLMLDIDKFKSVNDRWGHSMGDQVIVDMARHLTQQLRLADLGARLGGEEFAVVLPETSLEGAMHVAERIRQNVEASEVVGLEHSDPVRYTVSIGVATLQSGVSSFDVLLQRADRALYTAKRAGRNRVCASPGVTETQCTVLDGSPT